MTRFICPKCRKTKLEHAHAFVQCSVCAEWCVSMMEWMRDRIKKHEPIAEQQQTVTCDDRAGAYVSSGVITMD